MPSLEISTVKISEDPDDYHSHFVQLTPKTNKGQARYRCVTCGHEFSCSGKRRKLQHILGKDLLIGNCKNRNVVPCKKPYEPLKRNLLKTCVTDKANAGLEKTNSFLVPSAAPSPLHKSTNNAPSLINNDGHVDSEFHSMLEDILSWEHDKEDDDVDATITSFSASSGSSDEGDDSPMTKRMRSNDGTASEPSFSPASSFYIPPTTTQSNVSLRRPMSFTAPDTSKSPEVFSLTDYHLMTNRQNLNRAILNFFFAYQIPLQALESSSFQDMISQIQQTEVLPETIAAQAIPSLSIPPLQAPLYR